MSAKPPFRPVRDVMSTTPYLIDGMATVADAVVMMREKHVSSLVVDKRHDTDEYGMIVIQDLADKVVALDRAPERLNVYEVMSKPLIPVQADMDVKYAIRLLGRFRLSRAIVLDQGRLVGIATLRDLVLAHLTGRNDIIPAPSETT
ncbi:CBS domain-containing protein [Roseospira marina]|uniref:CBS domain-containing protein n=1 Tax=Roseospira marina TaxID=140057 RepID=A0A5M6IFY7_9PROT|nr:CBS domain-containing protein [Roseospira marina]KAA5607221.1 CBS domain-containing protein [Roseospira marina]MBB4312628.1 CBS domain-containing protein [Roseospira marina]MBB5085356.1 CBS domain-containing protein [Roseospira marina]